MDFSWAFVVPQANCMDVPIETKTDKMLAIVSASNSWEQTVVKVTENSREQVEPLLFGDGLLPQELQHDGAHQVPFVLKL